jgi:hypothetical protein
MALTPTPGVRNLLAYWGNIQQAAGGRTGVAGAWDALRTALGVSQGTQIKGFASIQDMNTVYGLAVANRNAAEIFASADPDAAILGTMIGQTPNARELNVQAAAPLYNVRVSYSYTKDGTPEQGWVTVQLPQSLEGFTVGTLTEQVQTLAGVLVTGYGVTTATFGTMQITAA